MPSAPDVSLRALLVLAWPVVVSRSTQVVIGLGDSLMVAPLGEEALAATSAGAFDSFALLIFPMGIVFIVSSFASQLAGAGDPAGARRYGWYGLLVALATQVVCLAALPLISTVLAPLPYEDRVRAPLETYLA